MKIYICLIGRGRGAKDNLRFREGKEGGKREKIIHTPAVVGEGGCILAEMSLSSPLPVIPRYPRSRAEAERAGKGSMLWHMSH